MEVYKTFREFGPNIGYPCLTIKVNSGSPASYDWSVLRDDLQEVPLVVFRHEGLNSFRNMFRLLSSALQDNVKFPKVEIEISVSECVVNDIFKTFEEVISTIDFGKLDFPFIHIYLDPHGDLSTVTSSVSRLATALSLFAIFAKPFNTFGSYYHFVVSFSYPPFSENNYDGHLLQILKNSKTLDRRLFLVYNGKLSDKRMLSECYSIAFKHGLRAIIPLTEVPHG